MGHGAEVLGQLWLSGIRQRWRDVAVPGWQRPERGSPCSRDASARGPAPRPPGIQGGLGPYLQRPGGLGTQQCGSSGHRASAALCWHLLCSESWVLISLWLPGRGREVALEWGGLARASIFNELDIYFSPSWLPPHRSLCHPPGLLSSGCQRLHGGGERWDEHPCCWEHPASPNPAPGDRGTLTWAVVAHAGRLEGAKAPLVLSGRVTSVLTILWGRGHAPAQRREAGAGAFWVWGQDPAFTLCGFKLCLAQALATPQQSHIALPVPQFPHP